MQVLSIVLYRRTLSTRTFRSIYNNSIVISRVKINDELAIKKHLYYLVMESLHYKFKLPTKTRINNIIYYLRYILLYHRLHLRRESF